MDQAHPHGVFEGSLQVLEFGEPFEEEAKWLGPVLLISEEAAFTLLRPRCLSVIKLPNLEITHSDGLGTW